MKQLDPEIKRHYLTVFSIWAAFIGFSCIIQVTGISEWTSLQIAAMKSGEFWRLVTGHITHLDWEHHWLNMAAITLSFVVFHKDIKYIHWPFSFLFISLFSSIGLSFVYSEYQTYVGFSDIIHGWIMLGAASIAHKEPKLALAILVLFWIKIYDENQGLTFFTSYAVSDSNVAKESHIFGGLGGMLYSILFVGSLKQYLKEKFFSKTRKEKQA